jgi:hypothetical protein
MYSKKLAGLFSILSGLFLIYGNHAQAETQNLYDQKPWSLLYYYGATFSDPLLRLATLNLHRWPEHIQSVELAKTLDQDNFLRQFVHPVVGVVQLTGNMTVRTGSNQPTIYEFTPYLTLRWTDFPWNHVVNTTFAVGEGISYASQVPAIEKKDNDNIKRLLNYLMFEATVAYPSHPELELVARIHHRSGAYGLYRAGNSGSNDLGLGIRYLFD